MTIRIHQSWTPFLSSEFQRDYLKEISHFLKEEEKNGYEVYPPKDFIFRSLALTSWTDLKVVIIGQDPYHGPGEANGLAFAVDQRIKTPPSLRNIFQELEYDSISPHLKTLEHWAQQGVLLLNRILTVRRAQPLSHQNRGWEEFTNAVIQAINQKSTTVFFLLWGRTAQSIEPLIQSPPHRILKTTHPSPLSAYRGFLGCGHFKQVNRELEQQQRSPIHW
jgi:uracil-DNA glycosylase